MVTIHSKTYQDGWYVDCSVSLPSGSRSGNEYVNLPEDATDAAIAEAIIAAYA